MSICPNILAPGCLVIPVILTLNYRFWRSAVKFRRNFGIASEKLLKYHRKPLIRSVQSSYHHLLQYPQECRGSRMPCLGHLARNYGGIRFFRNYPVPKMEIPLFAPFFPGYAPDSCYNGIIKALTANLLQYRQMIETALCFFRAGVRAVSGIRRKRQASSWMPSLTAFRLLHFIPF